MTAFLHVTLIIVAGFMLLQAYESMFGSSTLPRRDGSMAVFHYNNTIYILGGDNYPRQLVLFDVFSENITDYGNAALPWDTYGDSQYYTQIGAIFYWIDPESGHKINRYNLYNKTYYQYDHEQHKMIYNVGVEGCLASYQELLFVVGGTSHSGIKGKYQIFNLSSGVWHLGNDTLKPREQHTCMVDPERLTLYAILGTNNFGTEVEKISFNNSLSNSWVSSSNMQYGVQSASAVYYQDMILVIGGIDWDDTVATTIQTIDCTNGVTAYLPDLQYSGDYTYISEKIYAAAIVYDYHRIFLFGGYNTSTDDKGTARWQYIQLPTESPTYAPSLSPTLRTMSPTTGYPTLQTDNPTFYPTNVPTISTNNPTKYPSTSTIIPSKPTLKISPTNAPFFTEENHIYTTISASSAGNDGVNSGNRHFRDEFITITLLVALFFVLSAIATVCYKKRKQKQQVGVADEYYVKLIEKNGTMTERSVTDNNTLSGESISLQKLIAKKQNNEEDDEIYKYAAPTQESEDDQKEGNVIAPGANEENNDDSENSEQPELVREHNTAHSFSQILNDNAMGVDMVMNDIVQDMDTDK